MQNITVELLTQDKKQTWDDFVDDSNNGTIFHKQKFLSYHEEKFKNNEHHLLFYEGKKLIAVLPLAIFESKEGKVAKSPYGGSFGGFVYKKASYSNVSKIIKTFKEYAIKNNFDKIVMTLPPFIYHKRFETYQDFCLLKENFKLTRRDLTSIISLQNLSSNDLFKMYDYSCIKPIRKALRLGVIIVKEENILKPFHDILCEYLTKHNTKPTHSYKELCLLNKLLPDTTIVFSAYLKDEIIGGALGFVANKSVIIGFYACIKKKYSKSGIINLLYHNFFSLALEKGFQFFDIGTSTSHGINEGLLGFKESFGSTSIFRDTFTLEV